MDRDDADRLPRVEENSLSDHASRVPSHATLPPLRIYHFLVWMAVVAAAISFARNIDDQLYIASMDISSVGHILIQALAITLVGFGLMWHRAGRPFFNEPGHGLLLQQCLFFVWGVVLFVMYACYIDRNSSGALIGQEEDPPLVRWYFTWNLTLRTVGEGLLSLACAFWIAQAGRWRIFYLFTAIISAFQVVYGLVWMKLLSSGYLLAWAEWLRLTYIFAPMTLVVSFLACVVALDWRDQSNHHWSHWCGVVGLLITTFFP